MPPSAKKCSGHLPRVVLSSVRLACPPPPPCRPCDCAPIEVCTQGTCADAASCMQTCPPPVPEFCPHGLAQREEDCSGGCRDPPPPPCQPPPPPCQPPPPPCQQPCPPPPPLPPPPACPICAQHLADLHNPPPPRPPQTCPAMQPCCPPPPCPNMPEPEPQEPQSVQTQNNSHCSSSCGILKRKSIDADSNASKRSMLEMEAMETTSSFTTAQNTSSCCKSGSGIHAGPHMNARHSECDMPGGGKRRPSLVKIESKRRLSLQEPLDKNSGSACQHSAGLFPTPTAPCVCRMPPAYAPVCTGNISGSCKCAECVQEPKKNDSKTSKSKKK